MGRVSRENWKIIRDRLSAEIADGRLATGEQLPTEAQLCRAFETGHHSVRRAVATLAAEGKLRVEQGRGTLPM
jgi:GntR family phosphonate transport system transcriptional regulator